VRPWREVKSRRGAPKRVNTGGFACPNPKCPYFGITDDQIHALVGDGKHGQAERIQTFRVPACRTTFTARRHTPLYRLKTPSQQVAVVLTALAEGLDPSAAERVAGLPTSDHHDLALARWRARSDLAQALFLPPPAPTRAVGRTADQVALRHTGASFSGWPSIPSPRFCLCLSSAPAHNTWPICSSTLCDRAWPPFCLPLFTSDGLNFYFYALTAHFGQWRDVGRRGPKALRWWVAGV
jgi:transposase-like protein